MAPKKLVGIIVNTKYQAALLKIDVYEFALVCYEISQRSEFKNKEGSHCKPYNRSIRPEVLWETVAQLFNGKEQFW